MENILHELWLMFRADPVAIVCIAGVFFCTSVIFLSFGYTVWCSPYLWALKTGRCGENIVWIWNSFPLVLLFLAGLMGNTIIEVPITIMGSVVVFKTIPWVMVLLFFILLSVPGFFFFMGVAHYQSIKNRKLELIAIAFWVVIGLIYLLFHLLQKVQI
jgi:hypothetical protein